MNDPFINIDNCVNRLYKEYLRHPRLLIGIDFDSTIFDWRSEGHVFPRVIDLLRRCQKFNFYLVLFSAAVPERFPFMIEYCKNLGIKIDSVNENPVALPFGNHGKIYYNILLDDRAGLGQAVETLEKTLERIENSK